jgi:Flagellar hook-length control protein FliK
LQYSLQHYYEQQENHLNPVLSISAFKSGNSIENNMLSSSDGAALGLSDELLSGEFSDVLGDILATDGKLKPLDLAALKELGIEQLSDLEAFSSLGLDIKSLNAEQRSALSLLLSSEPKQQLGNADLFGNPDVNALLNSNLINDDLFEEGLLNNKNITKADLLASKVAVADAMQQSLLNKDSNLTNVMDELNASQFLKDLGKNDVDLSRDFLSQFGRQEINTSKLVEQFVTSDKTLNPITSLNHQPLKSYSGLDQSGSMLKRIEVPVNQPGWSEAVGNRLMMMVNGKVQSANIHLNPAELGPIEIRVSVNHEQASVHFVSTNSLVRDAIEDAFPRLKEMFSQNGLNLSDANVSQQSAQQGNQFSNQQSETSTLLNNDSSEATVSETQNTNDKMLAIGLIDQYV